MSEIRIQYKVGCTMYQYQTDKLVSRETSIIAIVNCAIPTGGTRLIIFDITITFYRITVHTPIRYITGHLIYGFVAM